MGYDQRAGFFFDRFDRLAGSGKEGILYCMHHVCMYVGTMSTSNNQIFLMKSRYFFFFRPSPGIR